MRVLVAPQIRLLLACFALLTLAACGGGGGALDSKAADSSTTAAQPQVSLQPSVTSVAPGGSVTLSWDAKNAQSCTASGGWSGSQPTSGTMSTPALMTTTTYTLTCSGTGGSAT